MEKIWKVEKVWIFKNFLESIYSLEKWKRCGYSKPLQKVLKKSGKLGKVWIFKNSLESMEKVWKRGKGLDIQKLNSRKYENSL